MNIKQKFESIDQSQLSESQKEILSKIKLATKNFTIEDKKSIEKVDNALDNIISKLEKTKPQAIKKEVKEEKKEAPKKEEAPTKETSKKTTKSETKTPKNSGDGKRTMFSIAKEIRKADESWEEAKKRAKKIMEQEKEETTKKMKTETEKLLAFIKRKKELEGLSGTSVKKDSKIEALPKGRRISKNGKRYYEYRDNRTDRLAPNFADKIYLEDGGYAGGGYVVIAKSEKGGGFVMSKPTTKAKAEKLKSLLPKIDGESNEVMTIGKASKLSGLVGKEYLKYADGGNVIDAFQMRTVRGVDSQPTEVLTNEQKVEFADGGAVGKKKTQKELRNEYLEKLGSKEADVWDKIGAKSGADLRNNDEMLKAYAEGVGEMLQKEGVGKGSFDQEDYDFYTDENWHLFNEFLVWNGYYEPEMTKTEKAWREDRFKDPKYRNYVSNPSVISVSGSSKSKSKSNNYLPKRKISTITIVKDGKEIVLHSKDVLNGVNLYDAGGKLKNDHVYFAKRYVKEVITEDGDKFKPSNGYWVKKSALKSSNKLKSDFFEKDGLGVKYVKNGKFDKVKFKKDMEERLKGKRPESVIKIWARELGMSPSKYIDGEIIEDIDFVNDSTKKASDLFENKYEGGGSIVSLDNKYVYITYEGQPSEGGETQRIVSHKYSDSKFDKKTLTLNFKDGSNLVLEKEISDFEKGKEVVLKSGEQYVAIQLLKDKAKTTKTSKSGSTKRGGAMQLAKQIRKDGESWQSALKRANEQMRKK